MTFSGSGLLVHLIWFSESMNILWSGALGTQSWRFYPHMSTWLRERIGANLYLPGTSLSKPCTRTGRRKGRDRAAQGRGTFFWFAEGFSCVWWFPRLHGSHRSPGLSSHFYSSGSIQIFQSGTKSHSRPADCWSLPLMLAHKYFWGDIVLASYGRRSGWGWGALKHGSAATSS